MEKLDFLKKLGNRIVQIRTEKGISQAELARICYKDRQSIERVENAKSNPTAFYLKQIADGLEVPLKDLLDFE